MIQDPLWRYFCQTTQRALDCYHELGPWMTAHITTSVSWPKVNQVVLYQGREFLLLPATGDWVPAIAINMRTGLTASKGEARTALARFASAVAWFEQSALAIDSFTYDNESPVHRKRQRMDFITDYLFVGMRELEAVTGSRALRALALYREGLSTRNEFYAALNFFKVVENFVAGQDRGAWFEQALPKVRYPKAAERILAIQREQPKSVGSYLAEEGRHAVAHAKEDQAVDPDDDQARFRFARDFEVFKALATLAIEEFVGVTHSRSGASVPVNYIKGFMDAQDRKLLAWLRYPDYPKPEADLRVPSPASLVVKNKGEALALRGMEVRWLDRIADGLGMEFAVSSGVGGLAFGFNLERRKLYPLGGCLVFYRQPDETFTRAMLDEVAALLQFGLMMWGNGSVWIIDEEDSSVWGQTEQVIPLNAFVNLEGVRPLVERIGALIARLDLHPQSNIGEGIGEDGARYADGVEKGTE